MSDKELLFLSPYYYPCVTGGIEVFNHSLIKKLQEQYNVSLITLCESANIDKKLVLKQIEYIPMRIHWPYFVFKYVVRNRNKIGLIYFSHARGHWFYWLMIIFFKKIFNINYGFTMHGGGTNNKKSKFPFKSLCRNAAFITGVSKPILERTKKLVQTEVAFTPPLVPFNIIEPKNKYRNQWNINADDFVILYVGSLKSLKAVDSLIEALGHITIKKLKDKKVRVIIAGDGKLRESLEKRSRELKLDSIIDFLGNVPREKICELYNLADIYTICSEFEGTPIAMLEAFANDIPCVTSDGPGLIDLSENNKNTLLFETRNSDDYARKLDNLLSDVDLRNKLRKNAKRFYEEKYSYDKMIQIFSERISKYLL